MVNRLEARVAALEAKHSRADSSETWRVLIPLLQDEELVALLAHLKRVAHGEAPSREIITIVQTAAAREGIKLSSA